MSPGDFTLKRFETTNASRTASLHIADRSRTSENTPTWAKLSSKKLLMAIQALALVSIFFEGYE